MKSSLLVVIVCLFACSKAKKETTRQTLHLNLGNEVATLDPRHACDDASSVIILMLYDGLVRVDKSLEPQLSLAKELEISADKKTFTFYLKKTKFANGQQLLAKDFVSTLRSCVNPRRPSDNLIKFYILKNAKQISLGNLEVEQLGVRAIDDYTLQFELENPCNHFLHILANWIYYPLPENIDQIHTDFAYALDQLKINNGPFILKEWRHREKMILKKNPNYWDHKNVHLDEIIVEMIEDGTSELALFNKGKLDFAGSPVSGGLPFHALEDLAKNKQLHMADYCKAYWYVFQVKKGPLKNTNLRKALTYAIDRKAIVENIVQFGSKIALAPFPPGYSFQNEYFENNQIELANIHLNKALQELGITKAMIQLKLSIHNSSNVRKIAETICYQWKKALGINVTIELNEWSLFLDKLFKKNYDMAALHTYPFYCDPMAFLEMFKDQENLANITGWENLEYKASIEKAQNSSSLASRNSHLIKAEKILSDQLPMLPIFYSAPLYIKNEKLEGFVITKTGQIDFKTAYFK